MVTAGSFHVDFAKIFLYNQIRNFWEKHPPLIAICNKSKPGPLAQSGASLTAIKGSLVRAPVRPHTVVMIYHEIISTVILPLPLIQEGHMSVSGKSMCTKYWLTV